MAKYINADRLIELFPDNGEGSWTYNITVRGYIKAMEEEDVRENTHGKWILKDHLWECDRCGRRVNCRNPLQGSTFKYNFCPNCGADMSGEYRNSDEPQEQQETDGHNA